METFELIPKQRTSSAPPTGWAGLETQDLLRNALWFIRIRWCIILAIGLSCLVNQFWPGFFAAIGIRLPLPHLPFIALALTATNLFYFLLLRRCNIATPRRVLFWNLWLQILFDLATLTVLVHLAGSTTTFISLTYLFHIMIACIFFAPPYSLLVTLLSALLFLNVVVLELAGILAPRSMLVSVDPSAEAMAVSLVHAFSSIAFWLAGWSVMVSVAQTLRRRNRQLAEANQQLVMAEERQNQQVLRTTHDLKAPFSGIESNIQLLRALHWDQLAEPVQEIIQHIESRSAALRERIRDTITLGDIKSQEQTRLTNVEEIDIPSLVAETIKEVEEKAAHRNIAIATVGDEGTVYAPPRQLKTLLSNLVANAVFYSHDGGTVKIGISSGADGGVTLSVADQGIGIDAAALPNIFDEYYRTREASKFNKMSTGLGLAIVKRIAENLDLAIRVHSQPGQGTTFEIDIPHRTTLLGKH
ncbi:MAG: hypothetical protein DRP64_20485 [Verrucomicrobia bacterium]|nr:MAG: hypothetical protein DRP64_20485 [Verrucomicrobiota bacterium]